MMEAVRTSETPVHFKTKKTKLHTRRRENLKFHTTLHFPVIPYGQYAKQYKSEAF
jgi:hypothetical protein